MTLSRFFSSIAIVLSGVMLSLALQAGELSLASGWVRETPPGAENAAAFLTLQNDSDQDQVITGVQCPAGLAARCEVHEHIHTDGRMRMQAVATLTIPAHGTLVFQPGGYHVMLLGIAHPLRAGERVAISFLLKDGANFPVDLAVKSGKEE